MEEANKHPPPQSKEVEDTTSRFVGDIAGFEEKLKEMSAKNK